MDTQDFLRHETCRSGKHFLTKIWPSIPQLPPLLSPNESEKLLLEQLREQSVFTKESGVQCLTCLHVLRLWVFYLLSDNLLSGL